MAEEPGRVPRVAFRDHAAADAGCGGDSLLRKIPGAISERDGAGAGAGGRGAAVVVGAGVLQPGAESASGGAEDRGGARREVSGDGGGSDGDSGNRELHGGGDLEHCVWERARGAGRQCGARGGAAMRGARRFARGRAVEGAASGGGRVAGARSAGRLEPGHDGAGRDDLFATFAAMFVMPGTEILRCETAGPAGHDSGETEETGHRRSVAGVGDISGWGWEDILAGAAVGWGEEEAGYFSGGAFIVEAVAFSDDRRGPGCTGGIDGVFAGAGIGSRGGSGVCDSEEGTSCGDVPGDFAAAGSGAREEVAAGWRGEGVGAGGCDGDADFELDAEGCRGGGGLGG